MFTQEPEGLFCDKGFARLHGASLIWPSETWIKVSFSNQHIEKKWPDPPPKPKSITIKKASQLLYASDTINDHFWDGKPLWGLVDDIRSRTLNLLSHQNMILDCVEVPSPFMVPAKKNHKGMDLYCLNNRRLWCLKHSSELMGEDLAVRVKIYRFSDCAGFWQSRITTVNGGCRVSFRRMGDAGPTGDMPDSMFMTKSKRKSEYLHLIVDGFKVDVLASCTKTLKGKQLANALLKEEFGQRNIWAAVCAAAQNRLWYSKEQAQAVKLAKLWAWYVAFPTWDKNIKPRGYLIELIV